jgi:hypothetical protein
MRQLPGLYHAGVIRLLPAIWLGSGMRIEDFLPFARQRSNVVTAVLVGQRFVGQKALGAEVAPVAVADVATRAILDEVLDRYGAKRADRRQGSGFGTTQGVLTASKRNGLALLASRQRQATRRDIVWPSVGSVTGLAV